MIIGRRSQGMRLHFFLVKGVGELFVVEEIDGLVGNIVAGRGDKVIVVVGACGPAQLALGVVHVVLGI